MPLYGNKHNYQKEERQYNRMKNCSNCGKNILDNMVRCPYCGATQKNVQKMPEETLENDILKAAERMDKKETNILLKILGSVLVFVC